MGKILANDIQFAKVFPRHNFVLYGILECFVNFLDDLYYEPTVVHDNIVYI